jgi:hypothetical protein
LADLDAAIGTQALRLEVGSQIGFRPCKLRANQSSAGQATMTVGTRRRFAEMIDAFFGVVQRLAMFASRGPNVEMCEFCLKLALADETRDG